MGRAGGGGRSGGGSHSSHSSHSFSSSRSGSSHSMSRSSSSGRSGGGGFSSRPSGGGGFSSRPSTPPPRPYNPGPRPGYRPPPPPPPPPRPGYYPPRRSTVVVNNYGGGGGGGYVRRQNSALKTLVILLVILTIVFAIMAMSRPSGSGNVTANTTNREKLELGYGYPSDTLTDELGWIKDPGRLNRNLKGFYDETGALPYVALLSYNPTLSQSQYHDYADQWYTDHFGDTEGYVLLVYFSSGQEDYGTDGDCEIIVGRQASVLMDAEAQNIFWDYLDHYWFSDADEDTLFAKTFTDTAGRIMQRQTTGKDVAKSFFTVMAIGCAVSGVICIMLLKRKHEAERAAETAEILSKPLRDPTPASTSEEEDLLERYGSSDDDGPT